MSRRVGWTRSQLLVAFNLYCQLPFGRLHSRNPEIIKYAELIGRTSSALALKLTNIASLDPVIISTGRKGLKGASKADKEMWNEMQNDWDKFVLESFQAMEAINKLGDNTSVIDPIDEEIDYSGKNKTIKSTARIGQSFFRKSVLSAYDYKCCITGLSEPQLLIASHIVPWGHDERNRLNPSNGLSLSMLHDKAFDIGIITINENMTVRVSQKVLKNDTFLKTALLNYDGQKIYLPDKFEPHIDFLAYHRENIFEA